MRARRSYTIIIKVGNEFAVTKRIVRNIVATRARVFRRNELYLITRKVVFVTRQQSERKRYGKGGESREASRGQGERARTRERMKTEGLALWRSREKTENFAV